MVRKHRLPKPTRFFDLPTKWKISPNTDEIKGNSGTAMTVPAVPRAAPLLCAGRLVWSSLILMICFCMNGAMLTRSCITEDVGLQTLVL